VAFGSDILKRVEQQFGMLQGLQKRVSGLDANVTAGIFGEEARYKRNLGTNLAAAGSDVGGTYNKLPLFSAGAEFAAKRMSARNAFEQARIMNLLGITNAFQAPIGNMMGVDQLRLAKSAQDYNQAFNIGDILGLFQFQGNLPSPFKSAQVTP
jgi:hypothetical protein